MTEKSTFARRVRAARPRAKKYEVRDDVVTGLALAVQPTGVRTYFLARIVHGRRRRATIGSADAMTIPEARREARRLIAAFTESGPRAVPLGRVARAHVATLPGPRDLDVSLFPTYADGRSDHGLIACWRAACADAGLGRLRLHDLRHTAASQAVMAGENLPLVGKLLGHRRHRTTAGYAHLDDTHLVEAAEKVGSLIADAMNLHCLPPPPDARARHSCGRWI